MARTPQQVADAWASGMQAATAKIQAGIEAVTESPTAKAAQSLDKYLNNVQAAVASGKMARKLNAVSLQDWKQRTIAKVSRIGSGAQASKDKMTRFLSQWLPFVAQVRQQIRAMPNATPQDRIARMVANAEALSQFSSRG